MVAVKIWIPLLVIGGRQDLPSFQEDHLRATFGRWYPNADFQFITDAAKVLYAFRNPEPLSGGGQPDNRIPIKPSLIDRLSVSGEDTVNETHELMLRLNRLLDADNIQHVAAILSHVDTATGHADKVLAQMPMLTADARRTLAEMNSLAGEFRQLSGYMRQKLTTLSKQSGELMQTGTSVGQQLLQTTLPRANTLILQMQAATRRFDRVAATLETDPQEFLLGTDLLSAPGEPGFKEAQ